MNIIKNKKKHKLTYSKIEINNNIFLLLICEILFDKK